VPRHASTHGPPAALVGVEFDITERKLYEDALFKEKESAQITLQSIGDGVITTDGHLIVEYLNPTAEDLTGWKFEEAQGKHIDDIFRGLPRGNLRAAREPALGGDPPRAAIKSVRRRC
jgi:PAS domain S-box-containing protein